MHPTTSDWPSDRTLDVTGTLCPIPLIEARRALDQMNEGEVLRVLVTDPLAELDLTLLCDQTGHEFLGARSDAQPGQIWIRVSAARRSGAG